MRAPRVRINVREGSAGGAPICFNGVMGSFRNTATGHRDLAPFRYLEPRWDLEPFWPSRQHHDFDRVCCRALTARAR
ncbi:hypothetical protein GCM10010252_37160 [Streptomyces aureoverticillatus]|nr:hypothetical protein GCM10010252_37160 [Streptomyces aureoverticillatus]